MPSRDDIHEVITEVVRILNEGLKYATLNNQSGGEYFTGTGVATSHEDQLLAKLDTSSMSTGATPLIFQLQQMEALRVYRNHLNDLFNVAPQMFIPMLREYAKFINVPDTTVNAILDRLWTYFIDNSQLVTSRGYSAGTPAEGTTAEGGPSVGDGIINRLSTDQDGYVIEVGHADTKVAECIADESSGATKHEEVFQFRGEDREIDRINISGSGLVKNITALSARNSLQWLNNPSFSQYSGTAAAPTAITGWVIDQSALDEMSIDTANTYRDYEGEGTASSLQFTCTSAVTSFEIHQTFGDRRMQFNPRIPWYFQFAIQIPNTAQLVTANDIIFDCGAATASVVPFSDLSVGWNIIRMSTGITAGGNDQNWYKAFNTATVADRVIEIGCNAGVAGDIVRIDDVVVAPYTEFDGHWYAVVGGATKFLRDDLFTWSDSSTDAGLVQYWLWRAFNRYLPHNTTGATLSDPA